MNWWLVAVVVVVAMVAVVVVVVVVLLLLLLVLLVSVVAAVSMVVVRIVLVLAGAGRCVYDCAGGGSVGVTVVVVGGPAGRRPVPSRAVAQLRPTWRATCVHRR